MFQQNIHPRYFFCLLLQSVIYVSSSVFLASMMRIYETLLVRSSTLVSSCWFKVSSASRFRHLVDHLALCFSSLVFRIRNLSPMAKERNTICIQNRNSDYNS
ncbi:hypothetical protein CS542_09435 [Pedobacter sp. IW39]|nr:hypothetical protein CS542_09435 [Pedobacter sp. IW39]